MITRNINGSWNEVLRWVEEMRIQSFPLGESLGFCTHRRNIFCFAEHPCVAMQFNTFHSFHTMPSAWPGSFPSSFFSLFLQLSSIPVLYSLLLPDTLEHVTLVGPVYRALKTETTPWFISFIYYLAGQAFESSDHCQT